MQHFSIIIPAHNEEKYIIRTLQAIEQQTYPNFEIIVITNGCTDNTAKVIAEYTTKNNTTKDYPQNPTMKMKNLTIAAASVSRARNYGASKASGEILLFLDADTLLHPATLEEIRQSFSTEHAVLTTTVQPDNRQLKFRVLMYAKSLLLQTGIYKNCSGVLVCRKRDFDLANGYDPQLAVREHNKLILKLCRQGKFCCIKKPITTSMRRFERWGLIGSGIFWLKQVVRDKIGTLHKSTYELIR